MSEGVSDVCLQCGLCGSQTSSSALDEHIRDYHRVRMDQVASRLVGLRQLYGHLVTLPGDILDTGTVVHEQQSSNSSQSFVVHL